MEMKKLLKKALWTASLLYVANLAEGKEVDVNLGYNAVENAITNNDDVRTRLLTNVDVNGIGYSGLNEIVNGDKNNYFGRHVLTGGREDAGTKLAVVGLANKDGPFDIKVGLRNTSIPQMVGYGSIDAVANKDAANVTLFQGIPLNGGSFELYLDGTMPFNGSNPFLYGEAQVNVGLTKNLSAYTRLEVAGIGQPKPAATGLVGLTISK